MTHDAAFKLQVISLAVKEGNKAAVRLKVKKIFLCNILGKYPM